MEFVGITITGWTSVLVTLSMAVLTVMMFVLGKERIHYVWGWFCLIVTVWIGAFYGAVISNDPGVAEFWWRISYVGIILIPFSFMHFVFEFTNIINSKKVKRIFLLILYSVPLFFIYLNLTTNLIVNGVTFLFDEFYYGQPGLLHPYFMILYALMVSFAFYLVYRQYNIKKDDKLFRRQVVYFFIANLLAFIGGSLNFLPIYEIRIPPISNVSVAIGAAFISYAILRYRLFDARVVTAQLLTFVLISFAIVRLIVSDSLQWTVFNSLLLLVTLLVGLSLIKGVKKEVEQREEIEKLAGDLARANNRLKELDELKTEFLSLASHQFRSPLTAMKGYASLILEGTYGKINPAVHEAVDNIFDSADNLASVVQDFLDVSRIEQGRMKYEFEKVDLKPLAKETIEGLKPNIAEAGLSISLEAPDNHYFVKADRKKINQVIINLVDNAQKYTKEGSIKVSLYKEDGNILIEVSDTGIGIKEEDLGKLFGKFVRNEDGKEINASGTGLGLYIVKKIVEAHNGEIWAESDGRGKGSRFMVELDEVQ